MVSCLRSFEVNAEEMYKAPVFYFGTYGKECSLIELDKNLFIDCDYTINLEVFVKDTDLKSWYVSPKWKCASEYIKLKNVFIPNSDNSEFAYGITDENGKLVYSVAAGSDEHYNTMYFTCQPQITSNDRSEMKPLGKYSDSYALTNFDVVIEKDTPSGEYEIYFLSEAEDYGYQRTSSGSFRMPDGSSSSYDNILVLKSITIKVVDVLNKLGDVNFDNKIDARDATNILSHYASESLTNKGTLDDNQQKFAKINSDDIIDARDATIVLSYYAYNSLVDNPLSLEEYIELNK